MTAEVIVLVGYAEMADVLIAIRGAESYDALRLLAQAIEAEGDAAGQIARGLHGIRDYYGASGTITFDENGDCINPLLLKRAESGKAVYQPDREGGSRPNRLRGDQSRKRSTTRGSCGRSYPPCSESTCQVRG